MNTPTPRPNRRNPGPGDVFAVVEVDGPLVRQAPDAARLARVLVHAAEELWDISTYENAADMWEETRAIGARILAACPTE